MIKLIISAFLVALLVLFASWAIIKEGHKRLQKHNWRWFRSEQQKNEDGLLRDLLQDITDKTDDWFIVDNFLSYGSNSPLLANNKKNIGVLCARDDDRVIVHLNLRQTGTFQEQNEDTIRISISGEHAREFISKAYTIVNPRNRELTFFRNRLQERL
jgi:hypothetical protein